MSYKWSVLDFDLIKSNDKKDVISTVYFTLETEIDGIKGFASEVKKLNLPSDTFIEYSEITEEKVIDWIKELLTTEEIDILQKACVQNAEKNKNLAYKKQFPWLDK